MQMCDIPPAFSTVAFAGRHSLGPTPSGVSSAPCTAPRRPLVFCTAFLHIGARLDVSRAHRADVDFQRARPPTSAAGCSTSVALRCKRLLARSHRALLFSSFLCTCPPPYSSRTPQGLCSFSLLSCARVSAPAHSCPTASSVSAAAGPSRTP